MCFWPFSKKKKKKVKGDEERWLELKETVEMDSLAGALFQERMNRRLKEAEDSLSWTAEDELDYQAEELQRAIEMLEEDEKARQVAEIQVENNEKSEEEENIEKKLNARKRFVVELVDESKDIDKEKEED
ncbi:hypothetical protein CAEBREN_23108 [Caenorhabditis brenneri]|uniref:Uncharacterized protein n=1 Tax=Caenorhabditis brenneri TaxID=135651 RepID=G0MY96_CAEBE|nr:hypothetical protein CAEBREN_23108 [Caenorhabditis brenneri]